MKGHLLFLLFTKSAAPGHCPPAPPPLSGPWMRVWQRHIVEEC